MELVGLIAVIIFGFGGWLFSYLQLIEARKQNKTTNERLTKSNVSLADTQQELSLFKGNIPDDIEIVANVNDALNRLNNIIDEQAKRNKKVEVQIFGLDLQSIIPWFMTKFIQDDRYKDIHLTFRLMLINPNVGHIKPYIDGDSNISTEAISNTIKRVQSINTHGIDRISLEIYQYQYLPIIHGYLVDKQFIGLAFTQIGNGKLYGGRYPYICCKRDNQSKFKEHLFGIYESWFEYYWSTGKEVFAVKPWSRMQ